MWKIAATQYLRKCFLSKVEGLIPEAQLQLVSGKESFNRHEWQLYQHETLISAPHYQFFRVNSSVGFPVIFPVVCGRQCLTNISSWSRDALVLARRVKDTNCLTIRYLVLMSLAQQLLRYTRFVRRQQSVYFHN